MMPSEPESPCIDVCTLDADGCCLGCCRTIDEITRWVYLSPGEKRAVLQRATERTRVRALMVK